jgi:hypothetical protein
MLIIYEALISLDVGDLNNNPGGSLTLKILFIDKRFACGLYYHYCALFDN